MKHGIAIFAAALLLLVTVSSCEKSDISAASQPTESWYLQNNLSTPVFYQSGYIINPNHPDSIRYAAIQKIMPGQTIQYDQYIDGIATDSLSPTATADPRVFKLLIDHKTKLDFNCAKYKITGDRQQCQEDSVNFFINDNKWQEIYTPENDSTSRIYLIDERDSLEAR